VGQVLQSRTRAELTTVTADIPAGVAVVQPLQTPAGKSATNTARALAWVQALPLR